MNKKIIIAGTSLVVIGAVAWLSLSGDSEVSYDTVVAERENLVQEISVTGRVEAVQNIDLAFENSGRISRVNVDVGDIVQAGQILVSLDSSEGIAQLAQAEAKLAKDQAKLTELQKGVRPEEIQVQEVKVQNAEKALNDAKRKLVDTIQDAYTKADDAVRNRTDQFFSNPRTSNPQLNFITNSQLEGSIEGERSLLENELNTWATSLQLLNISSDLEEYTIKANKYLSQTKSYMDKVGLAVNSLTLHSGLTQTTIDAWKLDVSTGRINVNSAVANMTSSGEGVETAKSNLSLAQEELILKKSGTIEEQIIAQEAQIRESEANIQYHQAQIAKLVIRAPFTGTVVVQKAKVGAIAPANTTLISVISEGRYQIEALVVEADISNLEIGDKATLLFDAYGEDFLFTATVTKIDPAAELVEGVANYRTTLQLTEKDDRIRAGMTADVDIITAEKENVITLPQRAVIFAGGKKVVRVLRNNILEEIEVETGITGERGRIEIVSGIEEGDVIVTAINN